MADTVSDLPTEVELALEAMPCQAMRRSYDSNAKPHPCALDVSTALEHPSSPLNGLSLAAAATTLREDMSELARAELRSLFMPLGARVWKRRSNSIFNSSRMRRNSAPPPAAPSLTSIALDPLTVIDDPAFFDALDAIEHLPAFLKGPEGLRKFYRRTTI